MHEEVLVPRALRLLPCIAKFKDFYLVGGTALALQIGHRRSVDFDLFTFDRLEATLFKKIKQIWKDVSIIVTYQSSDQLNLLIDNVKFTFFTYPYPTLDTCMKWKGISIASIQEIAAVKAYAIGRRLVYKDYVDWYFLLKGGYVTLEKTISFAEKKFSSDFNDRLFLGQLVSCSDISFQKIDFIGDAVSRSTIEKFLNRSVQKFEQDKRS